MMKYIDYLIEWSKGNKFLQSKIVNILLVLMSVFYVAFVAHAAINNIQGVGQPALPPINITSINLLDTNIKGDKAIFVILTGEVNLFHCETYILGSIIDDKTKYVLFDKVTPIPIGTIDEALVKKTPIKVNVGDLTPGNKYTLRTEFHSLCNGHSYINLAPLLTFEVNK